MRTPRGDPLVQVENMYPVEVFCRVKPKKSDSLSCIEVVDNRTIKSVGCRAGAQKETLHTFTGVFEEDDHNIIFENVASPMVSDMLKGRNGLLLTYGTTGSGKTYAVQGNSKNPGILPLTLDMIFNSIENNQTKKYVIKPDGSNGFDVQSESDAIMDRHRLDYQKRLKYPRSDLSNIQLPSRTRSSAFVTLPSKSLYTLFVSLVEIYNNNVFDLLQEVPDLPGRNAVTHVLREDSQRNVYVAGCSEVEVKSADDALRVFTTGQKRRHVAQTALNNESSRSHCIFTLRLVRVPCDEKYGEAIEDKRLLTVSRLYLVDLAGSERANRAGTHGSRLKEASGINSSLMNLRKCIEMLREIQGANHAPLGLSTPGGSLRVVPYRDQRLTHLFKNFFEGDGRVVMLVCIHQTVEDYEETMHVLKFAERSQEVSTFRTPSFLPPQSPAPVSVRAYRLRANGGYASGRSTDSSLSSTNPSDDQLSTLLSEWSNYDVELNRHLDNLLSDVSGFNPSMVDLTDWDSEIEDPIGSELDQLGQDSAPEHDQRTPSVTRRHTDHKARGSHSSINSLQQLARRLNPEPLRALIVNRMQCAKRIQSGLEHDFYHLRSLLLDLPNPSMRSSAETDQVKEQNDRVRLEAKIRQLERQVVENSTAAKNERTERLNQIEQYRVEAQLLRDELERIHQRQQFVRKSNGSTARTKRQQLSALRPSLSQANIVSTLSRQWESRLAEQQKHRDATGPRTRAAAAAEAVHDTLPSQRSTVPFNPRHRRSRSTGASDSTARWLEHQETNPVPLGTVFTPRVGRRKSVKQIELKDVKNSSNYLLHHQEADSEGNVETSLYKGSVIPTAGGGSAVIFDDVEELRQKSPCTPIERRCTRSSLQNSTDNPKSVTISTLPSRASLKRPLSRSSAKCNCTPSRGGSRSSSVGSAVTSSSSGYRPMGAPPIMRLSQFADQEDYYSVGISGAGGLGASYPKPKRRKSGSKF